MSLEHRLLNSVPDEPLYPTVFEILPCEKVIPKDIAKCDCLDDIQAEDKTMTDSSVNVDKTIKLKVGSMIEKKIESDVESDSVKEERENKVVVKKRKKSLQENRKNLQILIKVCQMSKLWIKQCMKIL
ncbi:hypothetical protein CI610_03595 [invertebrate metagenome]|uniref:Uncharacterized protein n=1 Tax=invertebrate metagenome TaxID=1711999 RepID=A0A2H9T2N4_9ZZZZ